MKQCIQWWNFYTLLSTTNYNKSLPERREAAEKGDVFVLNESYIRSGGDTQAVWTTRRMRLNRLEEMVIDSVTVGTKHTSLKACVDVVVKTAEHYGLENLIQVELKKMEETVYVTISGFHKRQRDIRRLLQANEVMQESGVLIEEVGEEILVLSWLILLNSERKESDAI